MGEDTNDTHSLKVLVNQSCPTLCDLMDYSLSGSSVHGILQAKILEWVAIPFSRGSSQPRDWNWVSCSVGRFFTIWSTKDYLFVSLGGTLLPNAFVVHVLCARIYFSLQGSMWLKHGQSVLWIYLTTVIGSRLYHVTLIGPIKVILGFVWALLKRELFSLLLGPEPDHVYDWSVGSHTSSFSE